MIARRGMPLVGAVCLLLLASGPGGLAGCKRKKPFPPAPNLVSQATTTEGAALPTDAGLTPVPMVPLVPTATPASLPAVVDTLSVADRAAFDQTKEWLTDVEEMVKKGLLNHAEKPDSPDAMMKCESIESARAQLEPLADPDAKKLVAESKRICSYEVPLLHADRTLKQVTISPSQASRRLMCGFASKDLEKARAVKPNDRRVRDIEARFGRACR